MAPCVTNTVHVPFLGEANTAATELDLHSFGEVLSASPVPGDPGMVAVVFFDVRSASLVVKALGAAGCDFGPQTGSRSVSLQADALFDADDVDAISDSRAEEDGSYVLEFFDLRVAARYSGGESGAAGASFSVAPPGLSSTAEPQPSCTPSLLCEVCVGGLPRKLLSDTLIGAILEQAGLDEDVVHMTMKVSKPYGEVVLGFSCLDAAERCVAHVEGCEWGQPVWAQMTNLPEVAPAWVGMSAEAQAFTPMFFGWDAAAMQAPVDTGEGWGYGDPLAIYSSEADAVSDVDTPGSVLSAAAAAWAPGTTILTAGASEFVPGALCVGVGAGSNGAKAAPRPAVSDTSTEVSEWEEDRESNRPAECAASA